MRKILLTFICICTITVANAQLSFDKHWDIKAHEKGQVHFKFGIAASYPTWNNDSSLLQLFTNRIDRKVFDKYKDKEKRFDLYGTGPWYARFQYGFSRKLSAELGVTYVNYKAIWSRDKVDSSTFVTLPFEYGVRVNNIAAMLRLNYHLFINTRWDVYIGGGLGYDIYRDVSYTKYGPEASTFNAYFTKPAPVTFESTLGLRYFFLNRTAWWLEVGYGKTYVSTGFAIKISQPKLNRSY
jgi:hypothetical protein